MSEAVPFQSWRIQSYDPVGRCIYCGSTENLSDEHIIPFGLLPKGGDWLLPEASCEECACITKKFEGSVQQRMLGPLREKLELKTRGARKKQYKVTFNYPDGRLEQKELSADEIPTVCLGFRWSAPGLLRGAAPTDAFDGSLVFRYVEAELKEKAKEDEAVSFARVYPVDFGRMLAKIAHAYAVAEYGAHSFKPALPPIILGKTNIVPHLVGGDESTTAPASEPVLHHIYRQDCLTNGIHYMLVAVRLFAFMGMPRYHVVVGEKTE